MRAERILRRFSIEVGWVLEHPGYSELTNEDKGYLRKVYDLVMEILKEIEYKEQTREPLGISPTSANMH